MAFDLPDEIWEQIFSYLSHHTLQEDCTLVCKSWTNIVRNNSSFSHTLMLRFLDHTDVNPILEKWPKLKTLYLENKYKMIDFNQDHMQVPMDIIDNDPRYINPYGVKFELFDYQFKSCPNLEKVVIPIKTLNYDIMDEVNLKVTKAWFNPQWHSWLCNIAYNDFAKFSEITIDLTQDGSVPYGMPIDLEFFRRMNDQMVNLESLVIKTYHHQVACKDYKGNMTLEIILNILKMNPAIKKVHFILQQDSVLNKEVILKALMGFNQITHLKLNLYYTENYCPLGESYVLTHLQNLESLTIISGHLNHFARCGKNETTKANFRRMNIKTLVVWSDDANITNLIKMLPKLERLRYKRRHEFMSKYQSLRKSGDSKYVFRYINEMLMMIPRITLPEFDITIHLADDSPMEMKGVLKRFQKLSEIVPGEKTQLTIFPPADFAAERAAAKLARADRKSMDWPIGFYG